MANSRTKHTSNTASQGPRLALLLCSFALLLFGLVMVYSASSVDAIQAGGAATRDVVHQFMYALVGSAIAVAIWKLVPYRFWVGRAVWIIWGIAIMLLLMTYAFGTEAFGARRWLDLKVIQIQPSEFVKIALLLMTVRILYDTRVGTVTLRAGLAQALILILIPLMFLYKTQSDLGTTLICAVGIFAVMWIGGVPTRLLGLLAGIGIAFVLFAVFGTGYRSDRLVYLNPWDDGNNGYGAGYNIIRSYYALAEGGLLGVGLGNSHEKFSYLFASDSDFIFAIIGEELGLLGALVVILLFIGFLVAGLRIATEAEDELGTMIAGGCAVMLVFQAFLNIGCVIGVLPTTGKPLPFISSGGSSLIATLIMVGLILSVSRTEEDERVYDRRRADLRLIRVTDPERYRQRGRTSAPARGAAFGSQSRGFGTSRPQGTTPSDFRVLRGGRGTGYREPLNLASLNRGESRAAYRVIRSDGSRRERMGDRRSIRYYERMDREIPPRSLRR